MHTKSILIACDSQKFIEFIQNKHANLIFEICEAPHNLIADNLSCTYT